MKTVAVVQARMGSTRLPGKVMMDIVGKPMLWHHVNRLRKARLVNQVVVATTDQERDRPIRSFAEGNGIPYYAGSELDLVDRLYQTANKFGADVVVRVTGDCPLVDPQVIDRMLAYYADNRDRLDYVCNNSPPTYPDGLDAEVISVRALERVWSEVTDPFQREWISSNFREHPEKYVIANVENDQDLSSMRWTVDYEDDLKFVRAVYERLHRGGEVFLMKEVLELLSREPELAEISNGHRRDQAYTEALKEHRSHLPSNPG